MTIFFEKESVKMVKEELYHWQDKPEDVAKCNEVFEKFKAAGLLEELEYIIVNMVENAISDEAYNADFSGN